MKKSNIRRVSAGHEASTPAPSQEQNSRAGACSGHAYIVYLDSCKFISSNTGGDHGRGCFSWEDIRQPEAIFWRLCDCPFHRTEINQISAAVQTCFVLRWTCRHCLGRLFSLCEGRILHRASACLIARLGLTISLLLLRP